MLARASILASGLALFLLLLSGSPSARPAAAGVECEHGDITQWPASEGGNDHYYRVVCPSDEATWDEASSGAEALGGYLATLTSEAENDFVAELVTNRGYWDQFDGFCAGPFIGFFEPDGTAEPDGGWQWVTGEPVGYENWAPGEPNNHLGNDENRAAYGNSDCGGAFEASDEWHDVGEDDGYPSYIVEWDMAPACVNTPVVEWPVAEGGNGHYYQARCHGGRISWEDSQQTAVLFGGYLATATSAEENDFIYALADAAPFWTVTSYKCIVGTWLGGFQPDGSDEPDGGWQWVTGEPFAYNNWSDGEPDNFDNDEYIIFWAGCPDDDRDSEWVDMVGGVLGEVQSYVVEWETTPPLQGDVNCDKLVNETDAILIVSFEAGIFDGVVPDCGFNLGEETGSGLWGDITCSNDLEPLDALPILLHTAGAAALPASEDCPPVGGPLVA
jgi:hypothetical protein